MDKTFGPFLKKEDAAVMGVEIGNETTPEGMDKQYIPADDPVQLSGSGRDQQLPSVSNDKEEDEAPAPKPLVQITRPRTSGAKIMRPLKQGTRLSGFVKAGRNRPPRECDDCIWFSRGMCHNPVVMIDAEVEGDCNEPKPVDDADCCDYFQSHESIVLYMQRHGDTELNDAGAFRGWMDVPLNAKGRAQAKKAAQFLKDKGIVGIVSSPLIRARETAEIIAKVIGIDPEDIYIEQRFLPWDVGDLSGESKQDNKHILDHALDNPDFPMPNGESLNDFGDRHQSAFQELVQKADDKSGPMLVVFHTSNIIQSDNWAEGEGSEGRPEDTESVKPGGVMALYRDGDAFVTQAVFGIEEDEAEYGS